MHRAAPPLALILLVLGGSTSCAPGDGEALEDDPSPAPEVTAGGAMPPTDRDPLPYTPPPSARGATGETVALAASGGEDQARRILPALLEAMRDANEPRLETLLAEELVQARSRTNSRQPRATIIQRMLIYARRSVIPADASADDLVALDQLTVTRAAQHYENREMPETIRPTDLVVEVPLRDAARGPLRTMLGWQSRGLLIVRPGRDPRVVAL